MEIANARIRIDKQGSDVPKNGITPAEAILLHIFLQARCGGSTFGEDMDKIKVVGTAQTIEKPAVLDPETGEVLEEAKTRDRTDSEELKRLQSKYSHVTNKKGDKIVRLLWPDIMNPKLPQHFADIPWKEVTYDGTDIGTFDYGTSGGAAITQ